VNREHLHLMARVGTAIYQQDDLQQTDLDAVYDEVEKLVTEVEHLRGERAAVVAYVRSEANQPRPIEAGERALSPSGRGLLLFYADRIERGEHRREEER